MNEQLNEMSNILLILLTTPQGTTLLFLSGLRSRKRFNGDSQTAAMYPSKFIDGDILNL
jgi:hypothetical protein